ncbi:H-type small acid-soluble spore protein [Alicyclobacillus dauci]|uniref:H-type small acid-soluble spore protein n=1 Tax=Alicyclobacillus dauci TaxID=1475485 RepID=A0ABY6YZZ2_9BACL|nr:H-type small acid-soluble spore protein [Alicyclobacillus dauci]WAH36039.1 H-type small acid-soluble spore protein [Alicyclobacillus dauci]
MDIERAKEIVDSPEYITVTYNGTPVHIDQIFESAPYAEVRYENGSVTNALVKELKEERSVH